MIYPEAAKLIEQLSLPVLHAWVNDPLSDDNPVFRAVHLLVNIGPLEASAVDVRRCLLRQAYNKFVIWKWQHDEIEAKL
ncbi:MAG: hypothetical protein ACYSWO_08625 [Planctomycetota bacterium]